MRGLYCLRLLSLLIVTAMASLAWSQSVITCSSDDMHYHACDIGPNHGVTLVRQHSDAQCIQGRTYGVRGNQVWVDRGCRADFQVNPQGNHGGWNNGWNQGEGSIVTCSSDDMHRHYCSIPDHSQVRVARQHSDAQCVQGQTYGVRGNQLWVDRGCRADFQVISGGHHGWRHDHDDDHDRDHDGDHDWDYGSSSPRTVTCSSDDMHRHTCDVGSNNGIRLVRQRSDAHCDFNRTYGFHGSQIWVDRGCRADFEVTPFGRRPPRP